MIKLLIGKVEAYEGNLAGGIAKKVETAKGMKFEIIGRLIKKNRKG